MIIIFLLIIDEKVNEIYLKIKKEGSNYPIVCMYNIYIYTYIVG